MAVKTKTEAPKTSEPRKIDEKDLNTLKQLQADTDKLVYNLGQLNREEVLGKELSAKYGIGTVNIEAGMFTPQAS